MISVCCICGESAKSFNNPDWEYSEFCPEHAKGLEIQSYTNPKNMFQDFSNIQKQLTKFIKLK